MLQNFVRIAIRSLQRNLIYSFINIAGLSIGIASVILILLWVHDELTFNHYFNNYPSLYQVKLNNRVDSGVITGNLTPYPLKAHLQEDHRIKHVAIMIYQSALLSIGDRKIRKTGIDASEPFLRMFDFKMIHGDPKTALNDPAMLMNEYIRFR